MGTINSVASVLSSVDCSNAPTSCAAKYRKGCSTTPQTCGLCMTGYFGIVGDSNTPCRKISSPVHMFSKLKHLQSEDGLIGSIGAACSLDEECLYYSCSENICVAPSKICPSLTYSECSGKGKCKFFDLSGNNVSTCAINEPSCFPACECSEGFGGKNCGMSTEELEGKRLSRLKMCDGLIKATSGSDPSLALVDSLTKSLLQTFDPFEMTDSESIETCTTALKALTNLVSTGLLKGSDISISINIAKTISLFGDIKASSLSDGETASPTSSPTSSSDY